MRSAGLITVRYFTVGRFTPNRTPQWLAASLVNLPFRVPVFGLYTITMGFKEGNAGR